MSANDMGSRNRDIFLKPTEEALLIGLSEPAATFTHQKNAVKVVQTETDETSVLGQSIERGLNVLREQLKTMPLLPGVYRMLDGKGDPLYVGKAKSLKKRVVSYTHIDKLPMRLQRMVSETVDMEIVVTHTEVEALLLEANMIKRFMPRYNVLLRDDKSFPYILIRRDQEFAEITKHRGAQKIEGDYFGPFTSAGAVNRTLTALEKAFLLRSCSDHEFQNRTRPCLLHQIKRCSAPCVGKISKPDYANLVTEARAFLFGQSSKVQEVMAEQMQQAAADLNFENAARYRDRIRALTAIQVKQDVNLEGLVDDADVIAAHHQDGQTCIQVFFFRGGRNYGNRPYFPSHDKKMELEEVLSSFISQFYFDKPTPKQILVSLKPSESELLAEALSIRADHKVEVLVPQRGPRRKIIDSAVRNAEEALKRRQSESATQKKLLDGVAKILGHDGDIDRIEVYDNSHLHGTNAYGCMIVAGPEGMRKSAYRKWSIKGEASKDTAVGGDDYAMMVETLTRRFKRAKTERATSEAEGRVDANWPDVVMLDGGKGQLSVVQKVFDDLEIEDVTLCAIAKGTDRDAGRETVFMTNKAPFKLEHNDPVLFFIQRLRDEAHRFAIGTHRAKRGKTMQKSALDGVPGIGPKRKKALLNHFGSARAVTRAGLDDLRSAEGVSAAIAEQIYNHFHQR